MRKTTPFDETLVTHRFEYEISPEDIEKICGELNSKVATMDDVTAIWNCAGLMANYGKIEFGRMRLAKDGKKFHGFNFYNDVIKRNDGSLLVKSRCYAEYSESVDMPVNPVRAAC